MDSLYRTAWRWHFYAGIVILPVLVWLAVTGALYLYKPEIERLVYRDWIELGAPVRPLPADALVERVERATGAQVAQIARPASTGDSWRMTLTVEDGSRRTAFVDPATGKVLGVTGDGGVMGTVRELHSLAITGPVGNAVVEIVAGWTVILVLTGFYLWWPRRGQRALALRGRPGERRFWRDFHASVGAIAGAVILFLAVTGMPWSVVWGGNLQRLVAANGLGRPEAPAASGGTGGHGHHAPASPARETLPWSMQAAPAPHAHGVWDVGIARVLEVAQGRGLAPPYSVGVPTRPGAPYLVSRTVSRAADAHLLYVEPATGRVLQDVRAADFGPGARAIEWGIYTHQGQTYGEANRLAMLAGCLSVLLLAASAPVLWWKRRRAGRLTAPPRPTDPARGRGLVAIMATFGVLFPLTGATMLAAGAADLLLRRRGRSSA